MGYRRAACAYVLCVCTYVSVFTHTHTHTHTPHAHTHTHTHTHTHIGECDGTPQLESAGGGKEGGVAGVRRVVKVKGNKGASAPALPKPP